MEQNNHSRKAGNTPPSSHSYPLEELVSASSIIFYHCKAKKHFPLLFISDNVSDVLGLAADKFWEDETFWTGRIHPEDREEVSEKFKSIYDTEQFSVEYRFKHGQGHYIWLHEEVKLIRDEEGTPETVVGSSVEVTERKDAERELQFLNRQLEEKIEERTVDLMMANRRLKLLEMAIENINDMVVITKAPKSDPLDSNIVFVNRAFEEFTGYSSDEVKGKETTFLHGEKTSQEALNSVEEKVSEIEPLRVELVNYKKDGSTYWVELDMAPFPAEKDDEIYWVGINRNITHRKEADQDLKREKNFVEVAINSLPGVFYMLDDAFNFVRVNDNFKRELGYSREELTEMTVEDLFPPEERTKQMADVKKSFKMEERSTVAKVQKKDGSTAYYLFTERQFDDEGQHYIVGTGIDINEQQQAEHKLKESLKEKEVLLSEIHHRVKNNLAIISGLLDLQAFNAENEVVLQKLRESQSRIQSIAMVHEKLYQSSSLSSIEMNTYIKQLTDYISGIFSGEDKRIEIRNNAEEIGLGIKDAVPCGLILNELLTNSFKHAFKKGQSGVITVDFHKKEDDIEMRVSDTGQGLPEDFDINSSHSLGMTLVQTLVDQLGADIDINSGPGGTTIIITFKSSD